MADPINAVLGLIVSTTMLASATTIISLEAKDNTRTNRELCTELAHEVDLSVQAHLLTKEEAEGIKAKCFKLFPLITNNNQ